LKLFSFLLTENYNQQKESINWAKVNFTDPNKKYKKQIQRYQYFNIHCKNSLAEERGLATYQWYWRPPQKGWPGRGPPPV